MSADKKTLSRAERDEKRRLEAQKDRRTMALYTVIGVVVAAAALILIIWNSGLLQKNLTALDVNGTKYTAADVQYYYSSAYSTWVNRYALSTNTSAKKQIYDETTGQTWYDFLVQEAVDALTSNTALAAKARAEGYAISAESQAEMESFLTQLDTAWLGYGYSSRDDFIRDRFGAYMTYDRLKYLIEMEYLATDYAQSQLDAITHPDSDYTAYYQEHADDLDTIVYTQLTFQAQVPSVDEEGNPIEMTDEEKSAQLEALKAEKKALAEEVKAKLEGGAKVENLAEEYEDQLYSSALSRRSTGANASYSSYGDWLLDSARRTGDVTLAENDTGSACYYYVAVFEDRLRDDEPTNTVRHLLVRAGDASTGNPTQAQYDEAEEKAQSLLDEWKAGEATEDSFAALAAANSDDTGSASGGGLISRITSTSDYVEAFRDWSVSPARREGDTGLVKTEYGWHIMYYVSQDDPIWKQTAGSALQTQDLERLEDEASQGWTVSRGIGMNLISA